MFEVRIKKSDLLDALRKNRGAHRDVFLAAQDKFKERAIEEFNKRIAAARKNQKINLYVQLPVPEDHTEDYDRAIQMLEMSTDDAVTLDEKDFAQYVQDEWGWRAAWVANTQSYVGN